MSSKILLIYTGGTIGMKTDADGVLTPFDFNLIYQEFPSLRSIDTEIEVLPFDPIDSSNVSPELWERLARIIERNYDLYDGFVVLHGTDTMAYSASALSFMFDGLAKPVIFTGSQIPIGVLRTDGRENLITAVEIAAAKLPDGRARVPEVCIYFQNRLLRANRTKKTSAEELNAFASYNYPPLAEVGVTIQYNDAFIHRPEEGESFAVSCDIDTSVAVIKIFPGMTERVFRSMLSVEGVKGIVLETFGSGNAPTSSWFLDALRGTIERGVVVMNVTQCWSGRVNMDIYETGARLQSTGVVNGRDITTEAAVTKMMRLARLPHDEFVARLGAAWRGEMGI